MAQLFPRWTNKTPIYAIAGLFAFTVLAVLLIWYYGSPKYTDAGYMPEQPVSYSHKLHAGDLGIDCRYCHSAVEIAAHANIPPTQTCMNCHKLISIDNEKVLLVRESWALGTPIEWIRVHKLPDYSFFNHAAHFRAGVACLSCHGNVAQMAKIMQVEPMSMSWCLECHHKPDAYLRPPAEVTNMNWTKPADHAFFIANLKIEKKINPPVDCSGCHR